jgi:cytidylate kinase
MINKKAIIIGISGPSASGKSLLANTIVNELGSDKSLLFQKILIIKTAVTCHLLNAKKSIMIIQMLLIMRS